MKAAAHRTASGRLTASRLRADVYRVLDRVIETGVPAEVERRGKILRIVPAEIGGRMKRLTSRPGFIQGDPEDLVHLDWSSSWQP
jgi:hypothetical protein